MCGSSNGITQSDLEEFKKELIRSLFILFNQKAIPQKKWLKSNELAKMLRISNNTLQNLRNNGSIPFCRIGGQIFYDAEEINNLMQTKFETGFPK